MAQVQTPGQTHTYIITHYNPSARIIDLVSHRFPGQTSKRKYEKYFFGDFLLTDYWQKHGE